MQGKNNIRNSTATSIMEMKMIYLDTLNTPASVSIIEMLDVGNLAFQINFGTCATEQTTNCPVQATA